MKTEKPTQDKTAKKRFKVSSPGAKNVITDDPQEVNAAVAKLKENKANAIDVSDEQDKSTTHYTRGTFEKNYHAHVSFSN